MDAEEKSIETHLCHNCDRNQKCDMYHRPTSTSNQCINITTKDNYDIVLITKSSTSLQHWLQCWTCCNLFFFLIKWSERLSIAFLLAYFNEWSAHFWNWMSIRCDLLLSDSSTNWINNAFEIFLWAIYSNTTALLFGLSTFFVYNNRVPYKLVVFFHTSWIVPMKRKEYICACYVSTSYGRI